jgi:FkbM family methyltransferase
MKKLIKKLFSKNLLIFLIDIKEFLWHQKSYSQCGEDLLVNYILRNVMKKTGNITYLDVGANHPIRISNTYFFYKKNISKGGGILIEPNPSLYKRLQKYRSKDIILNIGISPNNRREELEFFLFEHDVLNTMSKTERDEYLKIGHKMVGSIMVQTVGIGEIFDKYIGKDGVDLLNLDVEGFDLEILNSMNFTENRPKVIVVETILHRSHLEQVKNEKIINFLLSKNYFIYADTYINTIFVDKSYWITSK